MSWVKPKPATGVAEAARVFLLTSEHRLTKQELKEIIRKQMLVSGIKLYRKLNPESTLKEAKRFIELEVII